MDKKEALDEFQKIVKLLKKTEEIANNISWNFEDEDTDLRAYVNGTAEIFKSVAASQIESIASAETRLIRADLENLKISKEEMLEYVDCFRD